MLIEFSVSNFRSFLTTQTLSMVAGTATELQHENSFPTPINGVPRLLRSAVIYGPNAAGKSNLVQALGEMQDFVKYSAKESQAGEAIAITPFLLNNKSRQAASEFEVLFIQDNVRYQYGFAVNHTRIMREWLLAYPEGRVQRWFERQYDSEAAEERWYFGPKFTGRKKVWQDATRSNALFLSTAIQLNNEQLKPVFDWFGKLAVIGQEHLLHPGFTIQRCEEQSQKEKILRLLNTADLSIADITLEEKREVSSTDFLRDAPPEIQAELKKKMGENKLINTNVNFLHAVSDSEELVSIPLDEESGGTKKMFAYAAPLLDVLENGRILVVDELDNSLHPFMVRYLLNLLHDNQLNPNNAQLIFTTHDTSLLDQDILRRDQVWFVEKDKQNATSLYPLSDFSPRKKEALERGYLHGRYGALPYIGEMRI